MKTFLNFKGFKSNNILILLFLSAVILSLSGCASAPTYSNISIPHNNGGNNKYEIAIKKQDIHFSYHLITGTPLGKKEVEIYKCLGLEIYKKIKEAGVLFVNKQPASPNIIYIHGFRKAYTWSVVNPVGFLMPISALFIREPFNAKFEAYALINGKDYTIKAKGSRNQRVVSMNVKKLLQNVCGDFVLKLKKLIKKKDKTINVLNTPNNINKNTYNPTHHKIFYYSLQKTNNLSASYADTDSNFKKLAVYVYRTKSPYIYSHKEYTYNAMPITTTLSGCKIISVIRQINGNSNPKQRNIENYKICKGKISEIRNSNMADWDTLPEDIKPVINKIGNETREYGKASANYYGYKVIGKSNIGDKSVYIYVLKGIRLEAVIK